MSSTAFSAAVMSASPADGLLPPLTSLPPRPPSSVSTSASQLTGSEVTLSKEPACDPSQPQSDTLSADEWSRLSSQFNMPVVISTFAAAVIVAFLSLVNDILGSEGPRPPIFYIGTLFSFLSMSLHLLVIIVAGRGASLASLQAIDPESRKHKAPDRTNLRFYLALCDQLQLFATLLFIVTVSIHAFIIFEDYAWPVALLGWCAILLAILFCTGYRKDSLLLEDFAWLEKKFLKSRFMAWIERQPTKDAPPETTTAVPGATGHS